MPQAYVLLDRDGVINYDSDHYIKSPEEWLPIPRSLEAIALLNAHDYKVVVITNQSGIGRGYYNEEMLSKMHNKMHKLTKKKGGKIHAIYHCPHLPAHHCDCRKPMPGMLLSFANEHKVALTDTYFIGDKLADIQAAKAAGAKPILVKTGKGQNTINNNQKTTPLIFKDLYDAAKFIISEKKY